MLACVGLPSHVSFLSLVCLTVINGEKATLETPTFAQKRQRTLDMLIRSLYQDLMPDLHKVPTPEPIHQPCSCSALRGLPVSSLTATQHQRLSPLLLLLLLCCFPHCSPAAYCCTTATEYCCNADFLNGAPPRIACCPSATPSQTSTVAL